MIRQVKRRRGKSALARESRRKARHKTGQARVSPQLVQVTEEYSYVRSLGRWRPEPSFETGVGTISISTSIDDDASLAKPGRLDVRSLQLVDSNEAPITGSFLHFHNHGRTDLERVIAAEGGFDSLKLEAPVGIGRPEEQPPELGLQKSHRLTSYTIEQPTRLPIEAALNIAEGDPGHASLGHDLYFLVDIKLYLPNVGARPTPRIGGIEIDWPWLTDADTALRVWQITRPDYENPQGFEIERFGPKLETSYDVTTGAIVCEPRSEQDSYLADSDRPDGHEIPFFYSMLIKPNRPLQLIDDFSLTARVAVTVNSLISGTEIGLHDATGYRDESTRIRRVSLLRASIELDLDRAMSRRLLEQRNALVFRGVQPSPEVTKTIEATVLACGYQLDEESNRDGHEFDRTIVAARSVAGKRVELFLTAIGQHRDVHRTLRDAGGPRLREVLKAGDVDIELLGRTRGDHRLLTAEMNMLHASLRSRLSTFVEA